MRVRHLFLTALLLTAGCSLISSPNATVKAYIAAAQKGDVETMTQLFSSKAIREQGLEAIKANNQTFADSAREAADWNGSYRMERLQETATPSGKRISFLYTDGTHPTELVFDLSKENNAWKIDHIGGPALQAGSLKLPGPLQVEPVPAPSSAKTGTGGTTVEPVPPPPVAERPALETKSGATTTSGGVLNSKAISLPKPPYPPIARAAKASGTVVVQVLVDENGNVASAHAVSGHPLLQAASVAAARGAKFSPTKISGQPVKVSGVITYNFESPQ